MNAVEFTTELSGAAILTIPADVAAQVPRAGIARVIEILGGADRGERSLDRGLDAIG